VAIANLIEQFPALEAMADVCQHGFIKRVPGIDVSHDKADVLKRLDAAHRDARRSLGLGDWPLVTAEQVHGNRVAIVDLAPTSDVCLAGYDGFVTNLRRISLGIHVADCGAVYLVDPIVPAIGLVHSGKKGSALNIVANAINLMREQFGSNPADIVAQLSPCIRPPHYEIDFAAQIREQLRAAGVKQIHDSGVCTACDLDSFYSYRAEKGKTGRMLALLGLV
jgi:polyphenol oxidase